MNFIRNIFRKTTDLQELVDGVNTACKNNDYTQARELIENSHLPGLKKRYSDKGKAEIPDNLNKAFAIYEQIAPNDPDAGYHFSKIFTEQELKNRNPTEHEFDGKFLETSLSGTLPIVEEASLTYRKFTGGEISQDEFLEKFIPIQHKLHDHMQDYLKCYPDTKQHSDIRAAEVAIVEENIKNAIIPEFTTIDDNTKKFKSIAPNEEILNNTFLNPKKDGRWRNNEAKAILSRQVYNIDASILQTSTQELVAPSGTDLQFLLNSSTASKTTKPELLGKISPETLDMGSYPSMSEGLPQDVKIEAEAAKSKIDDYMTENNEGYSSILTIKAPNEDPVRNTIPRGYDR